MKKIIAIPLISTALIGSFAGGMFLNNSLNSQQNQSDSSVWDRIITDDEDKNAKEESPQDTDNTDETKNENQESQSSKSKIKGTYYCWSYNVKGIGGKCSSPAIVLNTDSTYSMSSEKGTYAITGNQIVFSQSKIRGPGTFDEGQKQIVFNYTYNGKATTVTYLNYEDPDSNKGNMVSVKLTVIFPEGDDRAKWLSTVSLVHDAEVYDALCQNQDEKTLIAEYRSVENGQKYNLLAGSETIGEVDLSNAKEHAEFTIYVKGEEQHAAAPEETSQTPPVQSTPTQKTTSTTKSSSPVNTYTAPIVTPTTTAEPEQESQSTYTPPVEEPVVEEAVPIEPEPESTSTYTPPVEEPIAEEPVQAEPEEESQSTYTAPTTDSSSDSNSENTTEEPEEETSPYEGIPCDPNIPHYSQPGCVE